VGVVTEAMVLCRGEAIDGSEGNCRVIVVVEVAVSIASNIVIPAEFVTVVVVGFGPLIFYISSFSGSAINDGPTYSRDGTFRECGFACDEVIFREVGHGKS
jgi:hypothetical protein